VQRLPDENHISVVTGTGFDNKTNVHCRAQSDGHKTRQSHSQPQRQFRAQVRNRSRPAQESSHDGGNRKGRVPKGLNARRNGDLFESEALDRISMLDLVKKETDKKTSRCSNKKKPTWPMVNRVLKERRFFLWMQLLNSERPVRLISPQNNVTLWFHIWLIWRARNGL
jgi:hypothetical protein